MNLFRRKAKQPSERKSASYFFSYVSARAGLNGAKYDKLAAEGYVECVVAFSCINRLAAACASVEPQVYKRNKAGKLEGLDTHPLLDIIESPNAAQSGKEFTRYLVSYLALSGNAYVYGNGIDPARTKGKPPSEMTLLNPGQVKVEKGETLFPKQYEYKTGTQATIFPVNQITGMSQVMHLKSFNPLNPWYGMSPLEAAAYGVDIHTDGQRWNKSLLTNGARPSGALVVTNSEGKAQTLSDTQYIRVKEMINEQFSGTQNTGKPLLLEGGLDWKEMSLNPKDMEFLEGKNAAARDIALAFGVPPMLLGIPGDNTYSNMQEAKTAFWTDTVLPLLGTIYDGYNRWLSPLFGDVIVWYDEETIPALESLRKDRFDRLKTADWMTINEKRRASGQDDVEGGDVIFVPFNSIPLDMAGDSVHLAEPGSPVTQDPTNG